MLAGRSRGPVVGVRLDAGLDHLVERDLCVHPLALPRVDVENLHKTPLQECGQIRLLSRMLSVKIVRAKILDAVLS